MPEFSDDSRILFALGGEIKIAPVLPREPLNGPEAVGEVGLCPSQPRGDLHPDRLWLWS